MTDGAVGDGSFINVLRVPSFPECAVCCHPVRSFIEALLFEMKPFSAIVDQFSNVGLVPMLELNTLILRSHVEHLHPSPHRDWLWSIHADAHELTPNMWARGELTDGRVIERLEARSSGRNNQEGPGRPGLSANERILLLSTSRVPKADGDLRASRTKTTKEP